MDKRTVVLVDDLADLRKILRLILEHGGPFKVVGEGRDGEEAVALAAELHPDLLVMDVEMPGGPSGWDVLPRIREVAPETAVVILSGSRGDAEEPPPAGELAAAVLEKGLPPDELNAALVALLGIRPPTAASAGPPPPGAVAAGASELQAFASVAGHDLAQPLQVAYGYLEMLRADFGSDLDPTALEWLDAAVGSLERMRGFVKDLLGFARAGTRPPSPRPVDLAHAVASAVSRLGPAISAQGAEVRHPSLPAVLADEDHLVEVLVQLVDNAVTFAPEGHRVAVAVEAERSADGSAWIVSVGDDGPGVPASLRDRVFDPFARGRSPSGRNGAGLGLALCRKLVEGHGGRIWLDPATPDGGATFRFSLPGRP